MIERVVVSFCLIIVCIDANARQKRPCVNGEPKDDKCYCMDSWTGAYCHRRMHCLGFERQDNGSCVECIEGWLNADCDEIDCFHGDPNYDRTICKCDKPYSGEFCQEFETKNIYSYYNNWTSQIGILGVVAIVPMIALYATCEYISKRRSSKRAALFGKDDKADKAEVEVEKQRLMGEVIAAEKKNRFNALLRNGSDNEIGFV